MVIHNGGNMYSEYWKLMDFVLVIAWVVVKFGINTTSVALKFPFSMQQEWYLFQISLLFPCYYHTQ